MATYIYRRPDGRLIERQHSIKQLPLPQVVCEDGEIAHRAYDVEHGAGACNPSWTNFRSWALGVHPDQIPEAQALYAQHGIRGAAHDPKTGELVVQSRQARRDVMNVRGFTDFSSFSGNG